MQTLFEQIDKLIESTPFAITMIILGFLFTYLVIREARKDPK